MDKYHIDLPGNPALYITAPLTSGWAAVGEIKREGELTGGALIRNANTGVYAQANAGVIRTLDQREVAYALALTAGIDFDGETQLTASEAARLVGRTRATINQWEVDGHIAPVEGVSPKKYYKSDILKAASRPNQAGRPRKS